MPDYISFANAGCITKYTKMISLDWPISGFPPFRSAFAGTYTVGTGWDVTTYATGALVKRVTASWIDVYEAKTNHTASADPASDTTNWRHAGTTRTAGETDEWYNVDPIVKLFHRGFFSSYYTVVGWHKTAYGFQHHPDLPYSFGGISPKGTIARYSGSKYIAIGNIPFSTDPTNTLQWAAYGGTERADLDYKFSRYLPLEFKVGEITVRGERYSPFYRFYRCKADVDYGSDADGTGDPATDTSYWEEYKGERSLWLDFAQGGFPYGSPFGSHRATSTRYKKWKETTKIYLNDVLQTTKVREYQMDVLRRITILTDETTHSATVTMPSFTAGPSNSGTFPPAATPALNDWVNGPTHHYHLGMVTTFDVANFMWPAWAMNVSYTKTTYAGRSGIWASNWPTPHYASSNSSVNVTVPLAQITLGATAIEFEFSGTNIESYQEFDLGMNAVSQWDAGTSSYRWNCTSTIGWTFTDGSGTAPPAAPSGSAGVNTTHTLPLKVTQRIELSEPNTGWVADANTLLGAVGFPSTAGYNRTCQLNSRGDALEYTDGGGATGWNADVFPFINLAQDALGVSGGDLRLYGDKPSLRKWAAWIMVQHWKFEQDAGGSTVETQYNFDCTVKSYSFSPSTTVRRVQIADTDPSP